MPEPRAKSADRSECSTGDAMRYREVDTVTSNEGHVRLRIYDGDLKIDDAAAELLRIERAQHEAECKRHSETRELLAECLCAKAASATRS